MRIKSNNYDEKVCDVMKIVAFHDKNSCNVSQQSCFFFTGNKDVELQELYFSKQYFIEQGRSCILRTKL